MPACSSKTREGWGWCLMRSARGKKGRMRKMEGKMYERVPNGSQDSPNHPLSSPPVFVFFCLAAANGPVHAAVSSLIPVRFRTGTNWIIYVSRVGSAVAPLQLQSAVDKNGKLVHGRDVDKKRLGGTVARAGVRGGKWGRWGQRAERRWECGKERYRGRAEQSGTQRRGLRRTSAC